MICVIDENGTTKACQRLFFSCLLCKRQRTGGKRRTMAARQMSPWRGAGFVNFAFSPWWGAWAKTARGFAKLRLRKCQAEAFSALGDRFANAGKVFAHLWWGHRSSVYAVALIANEDNVSPNASQVGVERAASSSCCRQPQPECPNPLLRKSESRL